jgi:AmpD protein
MKLDATTGLLETVRYIPSANCDDFPDNAVISLLVIHCISLPEGEYGGEDVIHLFSNTLNCEQREDYANLKNLKVSAHLFIRRDGELLQFVPLTKRAWHAGKSEFQGQQNCNDFSLGIELEGVAGHTYTDEQYQQLAIVTRELLKNYPELVRERIVGHSDIAPERKTDPGIGFDWKKYFALIS